MNYRLANSLKSKKLGWYIESSEPHLSVFYLTIKESDDCLFAISFLRSETLIRRLRLVIADLCRFVWV